jgi:formylglycine-generating enzyme required for sulfatase activity
VYVLELCDGADSDGNGVQDCLDAPQCCTGDVAAYCTAGTAVMGCVPQISGVGVPSADAPNGFEVSVEFVPPQRQGLLYYGFYAANQPWAPFNPSFLCVAPPVQRTGAMSSGGAPGQCNGRLSLDFNAWRATNPNALGAPLVPGQTMRVQGWYRDPAAPAQTNLSDALRFTLCTGGGETTAPIITTCASALTISTDATTCLAVVPDLRSQVVATDNCTAVVVAQVPPPGTTLGVGVTPIVLRARDAFQNAVTCAAQLTVVDGVPPTIVVGATSRAVAANSNCVAPVPDFTVGMVVTEVCSPPLTFLQSPAAGTLANVGLTSVTVSVTDAAGNVATSVAKLAVASSPQCLLPIAPQGFVPIQPGTFQMGQVGVAEALTTVVVGYPFFMAATEVTQAQYLALMGNNPSLNVNPVGPVERVSWINARAYCAALNAQQAGALPPGYEYRLPTEAEWEYACRAGTTTPWNVGNSIDCTTVNFSSCGGFSWPVASRAPNAWGLHDMHGNVWEWCLDSFAAYPGGTVIAPFVTGGPLKIFRGGSWKDAANFSLSAFRNGWAPSDGFAWIGFRVVLAPVLVP